MSDSKRNGYELRTDLLGMAIGICDTKMHRLECNEHSAAENDSKYQRKPITPFTTEDVIAEAEKLYQFVQKKA
jgi:hypothetical protein